VAVHITDRYELELPALGRLVFGKTPKRVKSSNQPLATPPAAMPLRCGRKSSATILRGSFRSSGVDTIQLRTDEPYSAALGKFFENREKTEVEGMNTNPLIHSSRRESAHSFKNKLEPIYIGCYLI